MTAPAAAPLAAPFTRSPFGPEDFSGSAAGVVAGGAVAGAAATTAGSMPVVCLAHVAHSPSSFCCCCGVWFFAGYTIGVVAMADEPDNPPSNPPSAATVKNLLQVRMIAPLRREP